MKNKKILLISIITIITLSIIALIILLLLSNTGNLKSNKTRFLEYLSKNIASIETVKEIVEETDYDKLLKNNPYSENMEIEIKDFKNVGTTQEDTSNSINQLKLITEEMNSQNYKAKKIELKQKEEKVMTVETIQNGETEAIKFSDLFKQYISVKDNDYKKFFEEIGYKDEKIKINNEMLLNFLGDTKINFDITQEEERAILEKYIQIIDEKILNDDIKEEKGITISIDKRDIITNCYTLKMTTEKMSDLYIELLEKLKRDEIILSKLEKINIKERVLEQIERKIEQISNSNIGQGDNYIYIYESEGQTVRTIIKGMDYEIKLDFIQINDEKFVEISRKENEQEKQKIALTAKKDKIEIKYTNKIEEEPIEIYIKQNIENEGNIRVKSTRLEYEKNDRRVECIIEKKNDIKTTLEDAIILNEENYIQLDKLEEKQANEVLDKIETGLQIKIQELKDKIKIDEIKEVFEYIGLLQRYEFLESEGISEIEKNRFNAKFELFKGENLDSYNVLKVIDVAKENLVNLHVVSNQELKIELQKNNSDPEKVEIIKNFVEKQENIKYNIDIEYDETNGLIKYIIITIVE